MFGRGNTRAPSIPTTETPDDGTGTTVEVARTIEEARSHVTSTRAAERQIGLVATMGYLHDGHLSLVRRCRELADYTILSIYVNPLQFGPEEDFDDYPRDVERDLELARDAGVDLVFLPDDPQLYPRELATVVTPRRLEDRLCGRTRPGHFEGVLTVVAKLFGILTPDIAVFGQKDFQQSVLIRRMTEDLNMPVAIEVAPTVREEDGLAMSSRNAYLPDAGRRTARAISRALAAAVSAYRGGERDAEVLIGAVRARLDSREGLELEYAEILSSEELEPVARADDSTVIAVAAHVAGARLIDNVILGRPDRGLERLLQNDPPSQ